jgi:hypothetical protein
MAKTVRQFPRPVLPTPKKQTAPRNQQKLTQKTQIMPKTVSLDTILFLMYAENVRTH